MPKNKVQFNLKNVHYAPMTDTTTPAWDTPVPVPGAVSLALEQQGSVSPFYAASSISSPQATAAIPGIWRWRSSRIRCWRTSGA